MNAARSKHRSFTLIRRLLPVLLAVFIWPAALPRFVSSAAAQSSGPSLIHDLDPIQDATKSSAPSDFVSAGPLTFFTAADDIHGRELWKTDGTAGGTQLVADATPGAYEDPYAPLQNCPPVAIGPVVYYCPPGDAELWRSDGTADGTRLLLRNNPTSARDFANLTRVGSQLFFTSSSEAGTQGGAPTLWSSDGTPAGTLAVKKFPYLQHFSRLVAVGDTLFFAIGGQIWKSDGSGEGTRVVVDVVPTHMMAFQGELFYSIAYRDYDTNGLYRSDGTAAGTRRISPAYPMSSVLVAGNIMFFEGYGLWRSDGTPEGTFKLSDASVQASNMAVRGASLYFSHYDYGVGYEALWTSDGSLLGTRRLSELNSLLAGRRIFELLAAGNLLYFVTGDPNDSTGTTRYLWRSDLTRAGTYIVDNKVPAYSGAFHVAGDALYYGCPTEAAGAELCRSDGTVSGTGLVKDIRVGVGSTTQPRHMASSGSRVFWVPETDDAELWTSDGTIAGTGLLKQLAPGATGSDPQELTDVQGMLFFTADTPDHGRELWRSDGTANGTQLVKELAPGPATARPMGLHAASGRLLFFTSDGAAQPSIALWSSDGTAAGTMRLKQFPSAPYALPVRAVAGAEQLFFVANDGIHGYELWTSDGTAAGTALLADLAPGSNSFSVPAMDAAGDSLYFIEYVAECRCVPRLWASNGTGTGTRLVKDLRSELPGTEISQVRAAAGRVYFQVHNWTTQSWLWTSDGSAAGTLQLKPNVAILPVSAGQGVLFPALDEQHGDELWSSNGTAQGTRLVADIDPGPDGSLFPTTLSSWPVAQYQSSLVVSASDRQRGYEPWISDGTANGTRLLADLEPGPGSSRPVRWAVAGSKLFMVAHTIATGAGIWTIDLRAALANSGPTAANASFSVAAGGTLNGTLPGSDADGDMLTFSIMQQAGKGTAMIVDAASDRFSYTARPDASGTDRFTYRVSDGRLQATGTIVVQISAVPPVSTSDHKLFLPGLAR